MEKGKNQMEKPIEWQKTTISKHVQIFPIFQHLSREGFRLSSGGKVPKYPWFEFFPPEEKIKVG